MISVGGVQRQTYGYLPTLPVMRTIAIASRCKTKKLCYGRGTRDALVWIEKNLAIDERPWHRPTPKIITVAAIIWPYGISLPVHGLMFQRLYLVLDIIVLRLGLATVNLYTRHEVSMFTHYEDMKGAEKRKNWDVLEVRGLARSFNTLPFCEV